MMPDRVGQIYLVGVPLNSEYHEREAEGVVGPVLYSIVYENLFVGFDVSGSTKAESIPFGVPFGIFPALV